MDMTLSWKYTLAIVFFVVVLVMAASTAVASPSLCVPFVAGAKKLKKTYQEVPFFRGVSQKGYLVVIFLNEDTGSWTVGRMMPQNPSIMCPLDAGTDGYLHEVDNKNKKDSANETGKF
jgi:hypothetical protein